MHYGAKSTTCDYRSIDVRRWKRDGLLAPNQSFSSWWSRDGETVASIQVRTEPDRVILTYRHQNRDEDNWKDEIYPIYLAWTPCTYGGRRALFICPASGCGRRVAILFGGGIFACRHCYRLAYPSQRETGYDRALRRANKIRERLGWEPGILNPEGWEKPKGMHRRTFRRLKKDHDAFAAAAFSGIAAKLGSLGESMDDLM